MRKPILILGTVTILLVSGIIILSMKDADSIVEQEASEEIIQKEVVEVVAEEANEEVRRGENNRAGNGPGAGGNGPGAGGARAGNGPGAGGNGAGAGGNRQRPTFSSLDADGNGVITIDEIEASAGTRPNFVAGTLERFDANGDEVISEAEFSVAPAGGRNQ